MYECNEYLHLKVKKTLQFCSKVQTHVLGFQIAKGWTFNKPTSLCVVESHLCNPCALCAYSIAQASKWFVCNVQQQYSGQCGVHMCWELWCGRHRRRVRSRFRGRIGGNNWEGQQLQVVASEQPVCPEEWSGGNSWEALAGGSEVFLFWATEWVKLI